MIFVDTSAIFAMVDADDRAHGDATAAMHFLADSDADLITTNYVVVELLSLAQGRLGMQTVKVIVDDILQGIDVAYLTDDIHAVSLELFLGESRRRLSLVDCSSIAFMRRQKIDRVFAYDVDFEQFGIQRVTVPM